MKVSIIYMNKWRSFVGGHCMSKEPCNIYHIRSHRGLQEMESNLQIFSRDIERAKII